MCIRDREGSVKHVYFVAESKGNDLQGSQLRGSEESKIECARRHFKAISDNPQDAQTILLCVYHALSAKGYDPITQIVGYLISGDPTYITSYQNARSLICRIDRDELLEELVQFYLSKNV